MIYDWLMMTLHRIRGTGFLMVIRKDPKGEQFVSLIACENTISSHSS